MLQLLQHNDILILLLVSAVVSFIFQYIMDSFNKDITVNCNPCSELVAKLYWRHCIACFLLYITFILLS